MSVAKNNKSSIFHSSLSLLGLLLIHSKWEVEPQVLGVGASFRGPPLPPPG